MGVRKAEREALAALSAAVEPARKHVMRRVADVGAERTWTEIQHGRRELDGDGRLERLARGVDGAAVLTAAAAKGIRFVCPGDEGWPSQLDCLWETLDTDDDVPPPFGLYLRGGASLADTTEQAVTVVGSRAATRYGERVSADLGADLAMLGWAVVSGGAYGIDAASHRGCLAMDGTTVAVLACGADSAYPRPHKELLDRIAEHGLVVSELPPGSRPSRSRFLARNRIIAGLSAGTVVVEAALRSGAQNTAKWADSLSRPVMAVPGPVTSALSEGCHSLIRRGSTLVCSAGEIIDAVGTFGADALPLSSSPNRPLDSVSSAARDVFEGMPPAPTAATQNSIAAKTGLLPNVVASALDELVAAGLATEGLDGWRIA